jgi:hypothetical protein
MAGAGYKLFQTGDVLTAAQVNTYLNEQTVMVFANAAARTSALTSVLAEGMVSYLQDTNAVEVYNGTAWVGVSGAGDVTEVQAGVGISVASGTGPIPVITNSSTDLITTAGDLLYGTAADTVARLGIGTAGQVLKVNSGATAPEWGTAASGSTFVGAYATKTAAQTLTNNTGTILTWNAERFDTDGFHDNSTNNSRMTIPAGKGGKYLVVASAYWVTGSGYRELNVLKNGSIVNYFYTVIDVTYGFQNISTIVDCVATDYLELRAFQDSGGNLNVNSGAENSFFSVTYLGA